MTTTDSQSSGERPLTGETPPRSATTPPGDGFETGNPPDEAAVATETPKGFTLYWWAILAWIALIAVHAAATFGGLVDVPVEDDGRVAYWLGGSVGAGLIVMLIAWVVYRASKNLLASNTVFTVLVLLGTMGQTGQMAIHAQKRAEEEAARRDAEYDALVQEINKESRELDEMIAKARAEGDSVLHAYLLEWEVSRLRRLAEVDIDPKPLTVVADALEDATDLTEDYDRHWATFYQLDGTNVSRLRNRSQLDQRIEAMNSAAEAGRRLHAFYEKLPQRVRGGLASLRYSEAYTEAWDEALADQFRDFQRTAEVYRSDIRVAEANANLLRLYRDQWGRWRIDPLTRSIVFASDRAAWDHAALLAVIKKAKSNLPEQQPEREVASDDTPAERPLIAEDAASAEAEPGR